MTLNWSLYTYSSPWFSESRTKWCTTRRQGGASKETIRQNRTNFNPLWTLDCDILSPVTHELTRWEREREVLEKKIKLCTKRIAMRLVSQGNLHVVHLQPCCSEHKADRLTPGGGLPEPRMSLSFMGHYQSLSFVQHSVVLELILWYVRFCFSTCHDGLIFVSFFFFFFVKKPKYVV